MFYDTSLPTRRTLLVSGIAVFGTTFLGSGARALGISAAEAAEDPPLIGADGPFQRATVVEIARQLSKAEFAPPPSDLPDPIKNLTYDELRDIRFKPSAAVWANTNLPFQLQLFHRGFYFKEEIDVAIVEDGEAHHLAYSPDMFTTGKVFTKPLPKEDIGFAGIRLHGRINSPDRFDEVAVFQGASYFRSLGKDQVYGLSARGLALKVGEPEGEEFPLFRGFLGRDAGRRQRRRRRPRAARQPERMPAPTASPSGPACRRRWTSRRRFSRASTSPRSASRPARRCSSSA